jgi:hypothetical protein
VAMDDRGEATSTRPKFGGGNGNDNGGSSKPHQNFNKVHWRTRAEAQMALGTQEDTTDLVRPLTHDGDGRRWGLIGDLRQWMLS